MSLNNQISADFSVSNIIAAILGSLVSLKFVQGTLIERVFMAIGGSALSYYATSPTAAWLGMHMAEGLVGFLIGLFGMAIVAKLYEVVLLLDSKTIATELWAGVKKRLGLGG